MTSEQGPAGIYAALVAVQRDVGEHGIAKSRRNEQQKFNFRGVDDVMNALNPLLSKHGVVVIPRCHERIVTERKTNAGGVMWNAAVQMDFVFFCSADGSAVTATTWGEAQDSGDKATNKAMAAAYKYACFQTFCIPTEGDDDRDADETTPPPTKAEKPAQPKKPHRVDAQPFEFVEDALTAITNAKGKIDTDLATARIHASIVNNKLSKDELAKLREAMAKRLKELEVA